MFAYLDKNCVVLAAAASPTLRGRRRQLPARRAPTEARHDLAVEGQKGSPYAEDMGTYSDALMLAMGHDKPAPIMIGRAVLISGCVPRIVLYRARCPCHEPAHAFRRQPVPQQVAQQPQSHHVAGADARADLNENESYMQPGGGYHSTTGSRR